MENKEREQPPRPPPSRHHLKHSKQSKKNHQKLNYQWTVREIEQFMKTYYQNVGKLPKNVLLMKMTNVLPHRKQVELFLFYTFFERHSVNFGADATLEMILNYWNQLVACGEIERYLSENQSNATPINQVQSAQQQQLPMYQVPQGQQMLLSSAVSQPFQQMQPLQPQPQQIMNSSNGEEVEQVLHEQNTSDGIQSHPQQYQYIQIQQDQPIPIQQQQQQQVQQQQTQNNDSPVYPFLHFNQTNQIAVNTILPIQLASNPLLVSRFQQYQQSKVIAKYHTVIHTFQHCQLIPEFAVALITSCQELLQPLGLQQGSPEYLQITEIYQNLCNVLSTAFPTPNQPGPQL